MRQLFVGYLVAQGALMLFANVFNGYQKVSPIVLNGLATILFALAWCIARWPK